MLSVLPSQHPLFQEPVAPYGDFVTFEQNIAALAAALGIDLAQFVIDHLAVRVNDDKQAAAWLAALTRYGRIFSDNRVNGRVIYLIKLDEPLLFAGRRVNMVELPFPKSKIYPKQGWEHIECVVPFLANETTEAWIARVRQRFALHRLANIALKVSEPKAAGEQLPNPSLALSFAGQRNNYSTIKIHPYPIKSIVLRENM